MSPIGLKFRKQSYFIIEKLLVESFLEFKTRKKKLKKSQIISFANIQIQIYTDDFLIFNYGV